MCKDTPHQSSNDEGYACPLKEAISNKEIGCNFSQLHALCRRITFPPLIASSNISM